MLASTITLAACNEAAKDKESGSEVIIGKFTEKIDSEIMTPEILQSFGRLGGVDRKSVV